MARFLDSRAEGFRDAYRALLQARGDEADAAEAAVRPLVADVRRRGMAALAEATRRFDGVEISAESVRVSEQEIEAAAAACSPALIAALELAAERVRAFHEKQRPEDLLFEDEAGVRIGWRWTAVDAAGVYAPGGLAAYPSAVLMNVLPAKAAGVRRIAMATPPGRLQDNPAILAAAKIAGVDEVWRVGGAQAIAALAYGAGPIAPCDVIVGPGNVYVAAAKRIVFGDVGIDSIAGPSEVFVLCDGSPPPHWIAADLLAQAEHDPDAQSVLFVVDRDYGEAVAAAVDAALQQGEAGASARAAWEAHGAIVLVRDLAEALPLIDEAAPEHVQIASVDADRFAAGIRHAGAIFLGAHAPEALGDYLAGPNHVLPTGRRARFSSGLSTLAFMKRTTLIGAGAAGIAAIGPAAALIADAEGLPAHARSLRVRLAP